MRRVSREGGSSRIFRRMLFVSQCRKNLQETLLGCHYLWVSKTFMLKRVSSRFLSQFFCLMVPKDFVGELFCAMVQQISGIETGYGLGMGAGIRILRRSYFV